MNRFSVHIRDMRRRNPFILPVRTMGLYYMYFESELADCDSAGNILVQSSQDLLHWSQPSIALSAEGEFRGTPDIRSPKGYFYNGRYCLIASFRYETTNWNSRCFYSQSPEGPFRPIGDSLTTPNDSADDGTLYLDFRRRPWLIYIKQGVQKFDDRICALPLSDSLSPLSEEEIELFSAAEAPWGQASLSEDGRHWRKAARSPSLYHFSDGTLVILWTGDSSVGSAIGCARSSSGDISGPWQQSNDPVYGMDSGGASIFEDFDGRLIMSLHSPSEEGLERILLFEVEECDGQLYIINELTGNWYPNAYRMDGTMKVAKS